jgi:hypothetical protein
MAKLCFEDDSNLGFDNNNQYRVLFNSLNPFIPYNYNAQNNYIFACQEPLRSDTFRCSIDLQITKNFAFGSQIFEGNVQIVRWVDSTQSIQVVAESPFSFDISGAVGQTQAQTIFVEGDVSHAKQRPSLR